MVAGRMRLVCGTAWAQAPARAKRVLGADVADEWTHRAALREVLEIARRIRQERGQGQLAF